MRGRTVLYGTRVAAGVDAATAAAFAPTVGRVLADPRGWGKYGYSFRRAGPGQPADVLIRLETSADADALCAGAGGFSCERPAERDVVVHLGNWMGGSASRLPLERYRTYVVNHEVGHFLGHELHTACPLDECRRRGLAVCPASVMQQMTRGPGHVAPCVESDWPLDPDWGVDDPEVAAAKWRAAGAGARRSVLALVLIVLVVLALLCAAVARLGPALEGGPQRGAARGVGGR